MLFPPPNRTHFIGLRFGFAHRPGKTPFLPAARTEVPGPQRALGLSLFPGRLKKRLWRPFGIQPPNDTAKSAGKRRSNPPPLSSMPGPALSRGQQTMEAVNGLHGFCLGRGDNQGVELRHGTGLGVAQILRHHQGRFPTSPAGLVKLRPHHPVCVTFSHRRIDCPGVSPQKGVIQNGYYQFQ